MQTMHHSVSPVRGSGRFEQVGVFIRKGLVCSGKSAAAVMAQTRLCIAERPMSICVLKCDRPKGLLTRKTSPAS